MRTLIFNDDVPEVKRFACTLHGGSSVFQILCDKYETDIANFYFFIQDNIIGCLNYHAVDERSIHFE